MTGTHICHLSGGVASWLASRRVVDTYGAENVVCLFADTNYEEKSTYRFIDQCVQNLKPREYHRLSDGRTPYEVFRDVRFLGNSRVDPCSKILKRELIERWVKEHYTPENCVQHFGYDWTEGHRLEKLRKRYLKI